MQQVLEDKTTNPSEKSTALQKTLAPAVWTELVEEEEALVPMSTLNLVSSMPMSGVSKASAKPKAKSRAKGSGNGNPSLEATRQRTRTTRELKQVEALLKRASAAGTHILEEHGSAEDEPSLVLLKNRMALLKQASSSSHDVRSCEELFDGCICDPYLKDLQATLLACKEGVQTLGYVTYVRETVLDLQPSVEKVNALMDHQRNAFQVLIKIANCVLTEAEVFKTTVQALIKARKDEEEAVRKANEKERKAEEKRLDRIANKEKIKADKQKQKEAAEAEAAKANVEGDLQQDGADNKKQRRIRMKVDDLEDTDPSVLRTFKGSSTIDAAAIVENLNEFIEHVCTSPHLPAVARFRKASIKKVLQVSCLVDQSFMYLYLCTF